MANNVGINCLGLSVNTFVILHGLRIYRHCHCNVYTARKAKGIPERTASRVKVSQAINNSTRVEHQFDIPSWSAIHANE